MRARSLCDTLVAADNLTRTLADQGKCTEAEEMEMESEVPAARKRVLEAKHQDTLEPVGSLACSLSSRGNHEAEGRECVVHWHSIQ
jgi:hypothetical protein